MILLSKGRWYYKGIGLVEVIYKIVAIIINTHLKADISLHDAMHGLQQGGGYGTATLEANLAQQMQAYFINPCSRCSLT